MVFETVRYARFRILAGEMLRHASYAASAAFAALILLLLAGTQILSWAWLLPWPVITLGAGLYLTWRRAPTDYQAAQRVDHNLKLEDTLSTALFFTTAPTRADSGMRREQWSQAERIAASADPRQAIPIRMPRAVYGTALLALIAGSLFALRYGLSRHLDLRMPLARIVQDRLGYGERRQAARQRHVRAENPKPSEDAAAAPKGTQPKSPGELDAAQDSALDTIGVPNTDNHTASNQADQSKQAQAAPDSAKSDNAVAEGMRGNQNGEESANGAQGRGDARQEAATSGEGSSLLGKFRDALSSLLNRMRQSGAQGQQQAAMAKNGGQKEQAGDLQDGRQGQSLAQRRAGDAKDGQAEADSQNAQSAPAGSPDESGQESPTKQAGSGIGRQNGNKDVKLAEQLAAMGKISEIIGKRSANVSGELTVEAQNSNQQLRTPYTRSDAHHAEAGGEINRDEIPEALQAYVQRYFAQVRKQASAAIAPKRAWERRRRGP